MSVLFLISTKRIPKARINRFADMGTPWHATFFKLKYGVVNPPFITNEC